MQLTITRSAPSTTSVELTEGVRHVIDGKGRVFMLDRFDYVGRDNFYLGWPNGKVCHASNVAPDNKRFILIPLS